MCTHRDAAAIVALLSRPGLPTVIARDGVQHSWASYSQTMRRVILAAEAQRWLEGITVPVRLAIGTRDPIPDARFLDELARGHSTVTVERWDDADHDLPLTHPPEP